MLNAHRSPSSYSTNSPPRTPLPQPLHQPHQRTAQQVPPNGPEPRRNIPRPALPPSTPSSSSLSSFFPSGLGSKARSSVSFLAESSKPYRSALANAGSYVAAQTGLSSSSGGLNTSSTSSSTSSLSKEQDTSNDKEKTWGEWARDWRTRRAQEGKAEEVLNLLPGWVVRVPREGVSGDEFGGIQPFDLQVSTSGFANSLRSPENASRSQRVFMRLAKSFAALPQLPAKIAHELGGELDITPLPTPGGAGTGTAADGKKILTDEPDSLDPDFGKQPSRPIPPGQNRAPTRSGSTLSTSSSLEFALNNMAPEQLRAFHENLDTRLQPFWSSALQRRVQLSIYPVRIPDVQHGLHERKRGNEPDMPEPDLEGEPLMRNVFSTDAQGLFSLKITVPWERIVSHGPSLKMVFDGVSSHGQEQLGEEEIGSRNEEKEKRGEKWGLYLKAELLSEGGPHRLPPSATALPPTSSAAFTTGSLADSPRPVELDADLWDSGANGFFSPNAMPFNKGSGGPGGGLLNLGSTSVTASTWSPIASTGGIRVISDLDDTVKVSNILGGAREVFRNAFCRPVEETAAEGMSELYRHLATQGVSGFHYVSNSPYELLPVLQSFLSHHDFPSGFSLKLKYYGGRNLMNGLFEPPGDRKRPGIIEVMESFPRAKFVLIGDSGEQDLELYVAIAKQKPKQVLAIAIRDVTTSFKIDPNQQTSGLPMTSQDRASIRQRSISSINEADLSALAATLEVEDGCGVNQAKRSGLAGRTRDVARQLARKGSDLDLSSLKFTRHNTAESGRAESLSMEERESSAEDTPAQMNQDPTNTRKSLGRSASNLTFEDKKPSDPSLAQQAEQEIQALTAAQLKLVKRAAEWTDRLSRARSQLPDWLPLLVFQHPSEIESEIEAVVNSKKG